jgi:hypothetical protein
MVMVVVVVVLPVMVVRGRTRRSRGDSESRNPREQRAQQSPARAWHAGASCQSIKGVVVHRTFLFS